MKKLTIVMTILFSTVLISETALAAAKPNPTITTRDSRGVKTGTITNNSNGSQTLRDSRGIKTGTVDAPRSTTSKCRDVRNARGIKTGTICS